MDKDHVTGVDVPLGKLGYLEEGVVEERQVAVGRHGDVEDDVTAARVSVLGVQVLAGDQGH